MKNYYFPDEEVTDDDLYYVCYMTERIARQLKQPNRYVVNAIGYDDLVKKLSLADVLHSTNPLATAAEWIEEFNLQPGDYDVSDVDKEMCPEIPTPLQMGKVYKRLILNTLRPREDYARAMLRVYNSPICETIDRYDTGAHITRVR